MSQQDEQLEASARKERAWHEWMMVGVGLTGLLSVLAIIVSVVALASKSSTEASPAPVARPAAGMQASMGAGGSMQTGKPVSMKLVMKSDSEKAMKGPDGKYHDAVIPANFTIDAGDRVTVTVYNYDDMPHTWTATDLGVNQSIPAGSETMPSKTTFTFTAPSAGKYQWWCALPCDPYSMSTDGLMKGYVTVAA